jgi:phosphate uptake regulator
MLLNEFLKEHRKNEERQKQIDALKTQLKEQAVHIQRVASQIEVSRSSLQVAGDNP